MHDAGVALVGVSFRRLVFGPWRFLRQPGWDVLQTNSGRLLFLASLGFHPRCQALPILHMQAPECLWVISQGSQRPALFGRSVVMFPLIFHSLRIFFIGTLAIPIRPERKCRMTSSLE